MHSLFLTTFLASLTMFFVVQIVGPRMVAQRKRKAARQAAAWHPLRSND